MTRDNKINCAIVLGVTGDFERKINKAWKILSKVQIKYVSTNHSKPHIALTAGTTANVGEIISIIKKMKLKKFEISSPGLGIFANEEPNMHIRWNNSYEMIGLKKKIDIKINKKFYNFFENTKLSNWVPKTTLAWKDLKYSKLSQIIKNLNFMLKIDKTLVEYLYIIDFTKKEKIIAKIRLI